MPSWVASVLARITQAFNLAVQVLVCFLLHCCLWFREQEFRSDAAVAEVEWISNASYNFPDLNAFFYKPYHSRSCKSINMYRWPVYGFLESGADFYWLGFYVCVLTRVVASLSFFFLLLNYIFCFSVPIFCLSPQNPDFAMLHVLLSSCFALWPPTSHCLP